jgi:drug/metabolite transporter (DMT)-like permease
MSALVVPVYLFSGDIEQLGNAPQIWLPLFGLTIVTFLSRVTLFTGVKHLGGMQTAMLGLSELLVTLTLASIWLDEKLSWQQWIGAALLAVSLVLVGWEKSPPPRKGKGGWFSWISARPTVPTDLVGD